jgi:transcriptional regulator PpsR
VIDVMTTPAATGFSAAGSRPGSLKADDLGALLAAACDLTLLVDSKGVIIDVAVGANGFASARDWIGKPWIDTVTIESRPKVEAIMREALKGAPPRWRQINHPVNHPASATDLPMNYTAARSHSGGPIVVFGRDLRAFAALQQRVAESQQEMEREYARIRSAEKRYRLLFQLAAEAILILNADTHHIIEANPAALTLLGKPVKKLVGGAFTELFDETSRRIAQSFIAALLVAPRVDNVHVALADNKEALLLSGALLRQEGAGTIIVMLSRVDGGATASVEKAGALVALEQMPDAFVLTDRDRRILMANDAFVELVQLASEERARGEPIERWIGRPGVDVDVLFANLQTHGALRHFSTVARGEHGTIVDVDVSGIDVSNGARRFLGFCIRPDDMRAGRERLGGRELPRTAEQFTDLVGRVSLKNLVRETTDLIERLCIEAALDITKDNRASAAEMLGLSRQALYTKLRRYGLGDLDDDDPGASAS